MSLIGFAILSQACRQGVRAPARKVAPLRALAGQLLHGASMGDPATVRGSSRRPGSWRWLGVALAAGALACELPRDAEGTLERVRGGALRVGVVEHAPFVRLPGERPERPEGPEAALVRDLADALGARVVWVPGTAEELARSAEAFDVDLLVGGWERGSKLARGLGVTRPFHTVRTPGEKPRERRHVWLVPPGENAWLLFLDEFLIARRESYRRLAAEASE